MKVSLISAKYISDEQGLGFKRGATYPLKVTQGLFGRVKVEAVHGYDHRTFDDRRKTYHSLGEFLNSWSDIDMVQQDFWGVAEPKAPKQAAELAENTKKEALKV